MRNVVFCRVLSGVVCTLLFCATLVAAEPIRHRLLLLDESRSQLLYVDQFAPEKSWRIPVEGGPAWGLQLLDGGERVLTAVPKKGAFREYDLATQKVVREVADAKRYAGAIGAWRLPDGRTVLGCESKPTRFYLFDAAGKEVAVWKFPGVRMLRQVRPTSRNTLLFGSHKDQVLEISLEGKTVRQFKVPGAVYNYQISELPNGNLLAAAGYGGFLAETNGNGKIVRKLGGKPEPEGLHYNFMAQFQVLKNGNTVVATWTGHGAADSEKGQQLVEFDPAGAVVWKWHDPKLAGSIHSVIVLDDITDGTGAKK
ncbi:MAG: hypothetical protein LBV28_05315 [Puniceicoccales bacterium]|jgi:hypothetical protein|nr:hypothetical protein [Puniceicoccales bacterium]